MADIEFEINSLTLGELAMVEELSGLPGNLIWSKISYRLALVMAVSASRNGEPVPSWPELMSRKVLDVSPSSSPSSADNPSQTSSD